jgi:hypothetical protein
MAKLLDVVELRVASGRWPAGTVATVIDEPPDGVLVEVADEHGRSLDTFEVPREAVRVLPAPEQTKLSV